MIRRQARQRRDYLHRRALTLREAATAQKRAALKSSLASGKALDPTIANDTDLRKDYKYDETVADRTTEQELDLDDEYAALSGLSDPRVLVLTARDPSSRLRTFSKEVRLVLGGISPNRGSLTIKELLSSANASGFTDVIIAHEHRGTPTAMTITHLPYGPTARFSLHNCLLRKEVAALTGGMMGTVNETYPHLVFEGFKTRLGERVVKILKHAFPPREPVGRAAVKSGRVVTFRNFEDAIEVRHHAFVRSSKTEVALREVGPRFTMKLFEVRRGTMEDEGEKEWALSNYTRTGKKKDYL